MQLSFQWQTDIEPPNRGFVLHKLSAISDGKEVGYLKIAYIPKNLFLSYYPSLWEYASLMKGWGYMEGVGPRPATLIEKMHMMRHLDYGYLINDIDIPKNPEDITDKHVKMVEDAEKQLYRKLRNYFYEFKSYHVDRPYIAFISSDIRRKGIATRMLIECAKKLQEMGLNGINFSWEHSTLNEMSRPLLKKFVECYPEMMSRSKLHINGKTIWRLVIREKHEKASKTKSILQVS